MKRKLKKLLNFKWLSSKTARISSLVFATLLFFAFIYAFIPLPNIDDGYLPEEIRKVSFNAPLTIHFSQPMNQESVEKYFSIQPPLKGSFSWADSKTLGYVPDEPLSIGDDYVVSISSQAKSVYAKKLGMDVELRFVVTGPPFVKFISPYLPIVEQIEGDEAEASPVQGTTIEPAEGGELVEPAEGGEPVEPAEDPTEEIVSPLSKPLIIPPDQVITVMFDRPMRVLTTINESEFTQDFPELSITPPVKGSYRWVGTTAFQFIPKEWPMGTTYTLKLPKGIPALDGGQTEQDVVWQLATDAPRVIESDPGELNDVFPVDGDISLKFNQEMELDFIRPGDNVLLYPSNDLDADLNQRDDGFFNTEAVYGKDEDGRTDKSILVFRPEFPYQFNQDYKLVVSAGLLGATSKVGSSYGGRPMSQDFILNFKTLEHPRIVEFKPVNGEQSYKHHYIEIDFASPMTKELVLEYASLDPDSDSESEPTVYLSKQGRHAEVVYDFKPSTNYNFEFKGPFEDAVGNISERGFKTSFKPDQRPIMLSCTTMSL